MQISTWNGNTTLRMTRSFFICSKPTKRTDRCILMGSNETGVKQQNNWVHFLDSFCLFRKNENTDSQQIIPMFVFFLTWISNACSVKSTLSCFAEWLTTANACKKRHFLISYYLLTKGGSMDLMSVFRNSSRSSNVASVGSPLWCRLRYLNN